MGKKRSRIEIAAGVVAATSVVYVVRGRNQRGFVVAENSSSGRSIGEMPRIQMHSMNESQS